MSRKNILKPYNMFDGLTVNMSSNLSSNTVVVEGVDKATIHIKWTAGPAGEFRLSARNTKFGLQVQDDWYVLDMGAAMSITASDNEMQIILNECPFTEIRLDYVASSGSATDLKAVLTGKVMGA